MTEPTLPAEYVATLTARNADGSLAFRSTHFKEERRLRQRYEAELQKVHAEGRWHCETCACDLEDPTHSDGSEGGR